MYNSSASATKGRCLRCASGLYDKVGRCAINNSPGFMFNLPTWSKNGVWGYPKFNLEYPRSTFFES